MQRKNSLLSILALSGAALLPAALSEAVSAAEPDCKIPYTVALGDTLGSIAERVYGNSTQFNRIYYANQGVLAAGPTVIRIGQELRIPCVEEEIQAKTAVGDDNGQHVSQVFDQADSPADSPPVNEVRDTSQSSSGSPVPDQINPTPAVSVSLPHETVVQGTTQGATIDPAEGDTTTASVSETISTGNTAQPPWQSQQALELLTAGDYAPFTDPSLEGGGLITELLETLLERSDIPYHLDWINDWAAHLKPLLAKEKYDIGFPWLDPGCPDSDSPRCDFLFSKPVFELLIVLFTLTEKPLTFGEDDDILGKTLCRPSGYFTHDLDNHGRNWLKDGKITLERPKNVEDCFKLLVAGKVDAVAINDFTGRESIAKLGLQDKVVLLERELSIEGLHALAYKAHPRAAMMIEQIDRGLDELHISGEYDKIMDRHLRNHWKSVESQQ